MKNLHVARLFFFTFVFVNSDTCLKDVNGKRVPFCCNNSESKGNQCVECQDGYTSKDGEPCMPCMKGRFGRKCNGRCSSCGENQTFTDGCVNHQFQDIATDGTTKDIQLSEQSRSTFFHQSTTQTSVTRPFTGKSLTVALLSTNSVKSDNKGIIKREINPYSISTLSLAVLVIFGISFCIYKIIYPRFCGLIANKWNRRQETIRESQYNYIDENTIVHQIELPRSINSHQVERQPPTAILISNTTRRSYRSSSSWSSTCPNDGYLQPCSTPTPGKRHTIDASPSISSRCETSENCSELSEKVGSECFLTEKPSYLQTKREEVNIQRYTSLIPVYMEILTTKITEIEVASVSDKTFQSPDKNLVQLERNFKSDSCITNNKTKIERRINRSSF